MQFKNRFEKFSASRQNITQNISNNNFSVSYHAITKLPQLSDREFIFFQNSLEFLSMVLWCMLRMSKIKLRPWPAIVIAKEITHACFPCLYKYIHFLFGSFGLSTKKLYTIILCPSSLELVSSLVLALSVHTPPGTGLDIETSYLLHMCTYIPIYAYKIFSDSNL